MGFLNPSHDALLGRRQCCLLLGTTLGMSLGAIPAKAREHSPLVVIVSAKHPIDSIAAGDLRRAFLGKPVNLGERRAIPLNQPAKTKPRVAFDEHILHMTPDEVARYWIERRIQGNDRPPRSVPNPVLLRRVVARLPGAVGYLRLKYVDSSVRVLAIDGKRPDDPDYPLTQ